MSRLFQSTDIWLVQDQHGVVHRAQVRRMFTNDRTRVEGIVVALGCWPRPMHVYNNTTSDWMGTSLPNVQLRDSVEDEGTIITTWRIREDLTCLTCISVNVPVPWRLLP